MDGPDSWICKRPVCAPNIAVGFLCAGPLLVLSELIGPGFRPNLISNAGLANCKDAVRENNLVLVRPKTAKSTSGSHLSSSSKGCTYIPSLDSHVPDHVPDNVEIL
jgi:hypothetical protein